MNDNIYSLVRKQEQDYITETTTIGKYVNFSQYDNIEKIDAYLNSKHTSGDRDSLGRDKPFFNIVTAAVNIWYHATDLDRKNIRIKATRASDVLPAFVATQFLQEWMRREVWGTFLNEWGRELSRYGSAVVKFVEKEGELHSMVTPWNRLITDTVDFDSAPVIEKLYFTPGQLRKEKGYDQEVVTSLMDAIETRETLEGEDKDTKADFIEVYEVHGLLPKSMLFEDGADDEYSEQVHVISYSHNGEGGWDDFSLFAGEEDNPYMLTHLIKEDGRTLSIGAVESLFDAQWMQNHSIKAMKDQLDISSKLMFQTADASFANRNVVTEVENGTIFVHDINKPLSQINNHSHDITALQNFAKQWQLMAQQTTNTPDLTRGKNMPSGTTLGEVQILQNNTTSLFELMTENKGLALEVMLRTRILPFLKKQMNNDKELRAVLEAHDLAFIDAKFVPVKARQMQFDKVKDDLLNKGKVAELIETPQLEQDIKNQLDSNGNVRFFSPGNITWKEMFKDLEWEVDVEITDETIDKASAMNSLNTVLQIMARPDIAQLMQNPQFKTVLTRILEETGQISALEMTTPNLLAQPQPAPQEQSQTPPQPVTSPQNIGGAGVL